MRFNNRTPLAIWVTTFALRFVNGFTISETILLSKKEPSNFWGQSNDGEVTEDGGHDTLLFRTPVDSRREMMMKAISLASASFLPKVSSAIVGSLPDLSNANSFVQGLTINVADDAQRKLMIDFLINSFSFKILRQRIQDSIEETWLGFGPEQLSIPNDFELPISSFNKYGGHASINVRYDTLSKAPFYRQGEDPPGNNIAYLQLGVPGYRISQMVANGGKILDAYGLINVVSPSGLPIRGIVGISPDPIMFVAINCKDVQESKNKYENIGFVEQEVPYSRPSKGTTMFEPAPPKGSCYMSPSPSSMGVLLLPLKKNKVVTVNPVFESLNVVYNPTSAEARFGKDLILKDPSGVSIKLESEHIFSATEKRTR